MPAVDLTPLGRALDQHTADLVDDMIAIILDQIVELQGDEQVVARLRASVESNVAAIAHLLEQPLDIGLVDPPTGALQWSLRLAQRGIPLSVLWRAYHLCAARVLQFFIDELTRRAESVEELGARFAAASTLLNHYVDHVCERIGASYETERRRWLRQQDVIRADRIGDLLAGRTVDVPRVEAALSYRLAGRHLAAILWDTDPSAEANPMRLQRWAMRCADRLGCHEPPLVVARDQSTLWMWFTPPHAVDTEAPTPAEVVGEVARGPTLRAALGEPGVGLDGFRTTHRQATAAQAVALVARGTPATVTPYSAVSGISFLCHDLVRAREWVWETLGPLAVDDEAHDQLRVSVHAFLETGGSLSAASERLGCHKNTVNHRVRRAEQALGRGVRDRRVELEVALQACRWLGAAVLQPPL